MPQLFRTNPGLLAWFALFAIAAIVCCIIALAMNRSGASPRPIYWFAGLLLLVGVPQFLAHLYFALATLKAEAPRAAALGQLSASDDRETRQSAARLLFGVDADADLLVDAKPLFGEATAGAIAAHFASMPAGETVLLAQFKGYTDAEKAWFYYLRDTGLNQLGGKGDSQRGYAVTRPAGDRAYALHMGNMMAVWTGPSDTAIRQRMAMGGFEIPRRAPLTSGTAALEGKAQNPMTPTASAWRVPMIAGMVAIWLLVVVAYFFKGAAWAGSVRAQSNAGKLDATALAARLESINSIEAPFRIDRGDGPNELLVTWRYADAKWIDLARVRGMSRTFRIRLTLDESAHVVRATDYSASYDWSAGRGGADIQWKAVSGIVFFQSEHQRVFGLQLDQEGRFTSDLSYSYTFNVQEIKAPLISAVTQAGWTWRPVLWQGPKWLR